jgi:hypothetical protein
VDGLKDACLEFLLQYLPSMPIPPIDGEENGLEYSVSNLDLTRFKLKKEDVRVTLGDFSVLNHAADAARAAAPASSGAGQAAAVAAAVAAPAGAPLPPPPAVSGAGQAAAAPPSSTLLTVRATNISAQFLKLHWSYKQKYFPYLEGGGSCDAQVAGCSIALSFDLRRDFRRKRQTDAAPPAAATAAGSSGDGAPGGSSGGSSGVVAALPSGVKRQNSTTGSEGGGVLAALLEAAQVPDHLSGAVLGLANGGSGGATSGGGAAPAPSLIWEPVLVLGSCDVQIDDLVVHMKGGLGSGSMAWLYNAIATLFRQQIREYIIASLVDTIHENAAALLAAVNGFVRSSWPVVSAATHANLDNLPLLDRQVTPRRAALVLRLCLCARPSLSSLRQRFPR